MDTNYQSNTIASGDRHANAAKIASSGSGAAGIGCNNSKGEAQGAGSFAGVSFTPLPRAPSGASARLSGLILRPRFSTALPVVTALARHAQANPEHTQYKVDCRGQVSPEGFEVALGLALPTIVTLSGLSTASLQITPRNCWPLS